MSTLSQNVLRTIVNPPDANIDVVAVHGLNPTNASPHYEMTWKDGEVLWLRDILRWQVPTARVLLFGYNSNVAFNTTMAGILEHAENLLNQLTLERQKVTPSRLIVFICHSLGGILVKQALVTAKASATYREIKRATYGIAFFATPHRGGNHAGAGDYISRIIRAVLGNENNTIMNALKKTSGFGDTLKDQFRHQLEDYAFLSFYETRSLSRFGIIVDKESATLGLPGARETQIGVEADHRGICKFKSYNDSTCKLVVDNVSKLIKNAIDSIEGQQLTEEDALAKNLQVESQKPTEDVTHVSDHDSPNEVPGCFGVAALQTEHGEYLKRILGAVESFFRHPIAPLI